MSQPVVILVVILVVVLIGWFMYWSTQRQIKRVLRGEKTLDDRDIWLRNLAPLQARVISKNETVKPEAGGVAKVDLELEIQVPESAPVRASTCWLVEVPSLAEIEVGKEVAVKFDPNKPQRVFPAVTWARLWLFGKK